MIHIVHIVIDDTRRTETMSSWFAHVSIFAWNIHCQLHCTMISNDSQTTTCKSPCDGSLQTLENENEKWKIVSLRLLFFSSSLRACGTFSTKHHTIHYNHRHRVCYMSVLSSHFTSVLCGTKELIKMNLSGSGTLLSQIYFTLARALGWSPRMRERKKNDTQNFSSEEVDSNCKRRRSRWRELITRWIIRMAQLSHETKQEIKKAQICCLLSRECASRADPSWLCQNALKMNTRMKNQSSKDKKMCFRRFSQFDFCFKSTYTWHTDTKSQQNHQPDIQLKKRV